MDLKTEKVQSNRNKGSSVVALNHGDTYRSNYYFDSVVYQNILSSECHKGINLYPLNLH